MRLLISFFCLIVILAQGCGSNSPEYYQTDKPVAETAKSNEQTQAEAVVDQCRDQFRRALQAANPELMGVQADRNSSLLFLREWQRECSGKQSVNVTLDVAYLEQYLGKDAVSYAVKKEFDGRDVTHLRDAQLCYKLANFASQKGSSTLEKVLMIHEFAVNSVAITPGFENTVPRSCFEILKFGRGSKNDRVWIFANLLRQLRIDAFLIIGKPGPEAIGQAITPLVGVLIDGQVYLFDVICSTPIPSGDDPRLAFVSKPATFEELLSNTKLLESMFKGMKTFHPLASYDFSTPKILLISTSSFYAPRMKDIQQEMTGISPAIVFDELAGSANAQRERIFQGLKQQVKLAEIGIWSYPETMTLRFENPEASDLAAYKNWDSPFEMTSETVRTSQDVNENIQQTLTKEKQFLQARINQLNGNTNEALSTYGKIRLVTLTPLANDDTEELKREKLLKVRMSLDSSYWIAVAQAQNQKHRTAYENALIFVGRYPFTEFTPAAIMLAATSLAHENKMADAFEVLEKNLSPEKDPDFNRALFYYVWWGLKLQPEKFQETKPTPDKPVEKPAEKPASDTTPASTKPVKMNDNKIPVEKTSPDAVTEKKETTASPIPEKKEDNSSTPEQSLEKPVDIPEKTSGDSPDSSSNK